MEQTPCEIVTQLNAGKKKKKTQKNKLQGKNLTNTMLSKRSKT